MTHGMADYDGGNGITAGVIFHASENGEPIPFDPKVSGTPTPMPSVVDLEMLGVGPANLQPVGWRTSCQNAPERHAGMARSCRCGTSTRPLRESVTCHRIRG